MHVSTLASLLAFMAPAAIAAPSLVVASPAESPALRSALVEGGVAVLTEGDTAKVLTSAANSGVICAADDVGCWQAVATLAGHDDVVILTAGEVVTSGRAGVRRTPRLVPGPDGVRGAVLRHLGRAGGVVVKVAPPTATVTLNGVPLGAGGADGVVPGPVAVSATADGFAARNENVVVVAGEVARVEWTLTAPEPAAPGPSSLSPVLFWGGLSTVGVGAIAGSAIATVNFFQSGCSINVGSEPLLTCPADPPSGLEEPNHRSIQNVDYAAIAIGVGLSAVGAGVAVASVFVE